jgi:hypothetical protein
VGKYLALVDNLRQDENIAFCDMKPVSKMKKSCLLAFVFFGLTLQTGNVLGQGSLTPPGGPAPTMKSLDQIEPRTAISALPYAITTPGSYYVTTNISYGGSGITIASGNITLDLNGYTLQGGGGSGVFISGAYTNITIRNGSLINWGSYGVDGYSFAPRSVLVENVTVSGCGNRGIAVDNDSIVRNCRAYGNSTEGIYSHGGQIVDCITRSNITGIFGYNCLIRNCESENNFSVGIDCNGGSVLDSAAFNNQTGIRLYGGGSARRCHAQGNSSSGFTTANFAPIAGGTIADCVAATNLFGISLNTHGYLITGNEISYNSSAAIIIQGSNNRIDGNHLAMAAGSYGIQLNNSLTYTNNVIVRNTAFGGGSSLINYNISGTSNDIGPIGNASTNTSPWANISH